MGRQGSYAILCPMTWAPAVLASETADLSEDVRRLFRDIERQTGGRAAAGQCTPSLDVLETDELIELVVDLPGVAPDRIRIVTPIVGTDAEPHVTDLRWREV